jgi:hypothetical protein
VYADGVCGKTRQFLVERSALRVIVKKALGFELRATSKKPLSPWLAPALKAAVSPRYNRTACHPSLRLTNNSLYIKRAQRKSSASDLRAKLERSLKTQGCASWGWHGSDRA